MIYYLKPGDTLLTINGSNGHTVYQDYALTKEIPLGIYTDNVNIFQLSKGNNYNIWNVIELPLNLTPTPTPIPLSDELTILNQFPTGISNDSSYQLDPFTQIYGPTGEQWVTFSLTYNDTTGKVKVTTDYRGWSTGPEDVRYKVEISGKWLTQQELEDIDFSNQKGNDILIYAASNMNGTPKVGTTYLHIKGDSNTRLPGFVVRNPTKRMPQFTYNFPDIRLSPSKINILEFHQLDTNLNTVSTKYVDKGFSIAHGPANSQKFIGDYDQWAYENGAPGPHNQAGALQWLRDTSIQKLNNYFQGLIGGAAGVGFFFMDFEAFGYGAVDDQDIVNKLGTLFRRFNQANPDTIFTSYINANPVTSTFSKNISSAEKDLQNAKYTKTLDQIATGFFSRTVHYLDVNTGKFTGESGNMGQYIAPIVGNYMNSIGFSNLYSTIQEFELSKKLLPENKVLSLNWGLNETLPVGSGSDYEGHLKGFKKENGFLYLKDTKPPTPPSYMWNVTLWSNIMGDGTWFWDEPLPFIEGYEYYGSSAKNTDNILFGDNEFSTNYGSTHYYSQIGYDYVARALYFLSHNNDILEATTPIEKPEFSTDGGNTYYSDNDLLPASAEFSKLPLVRIKKHATLNEWIIIAVNHHLDHYINQTIKVKIGNKTIDIVLKGQYTTAERISLSSLLPTPTLPDPTPTPTFNLTSTSTKCNGVISWNNPTKTCKGNITTIGVSVNGNNNQNVEFSINGGEYQAPNVGINGYTYNTPSTGDLIYFDARIVGCNSSINGSVQSCDTTLPPKPPITPIHSPTNDSTIYKSLFTFNQKSNGQPIPTSGDYTNNYLKFHAFSHGISRNITIPQDTGVICKFEYEILNNDNEVVFSCKDNYGGFHPNFQNNPSAESYYRVWTQGHSDYTNFQWIRDYFNNFTAIPGTSFNSALDRGNNHFDIYNGYVPLNKSYVMKIKNTGNFSFQLRAGTIDTFENPNLADIYTTILPDNTWYNFNLNGIRVNNNNSGTRAYKINCYNN